MEFTEIILHYPVETEGWVDTWQTGSYVLRYKAWDHLWQMGEANRTVTVVEDTTPPVITLNGDSEVWLDIDEDYKDAGISVTDNCGGSPEVYVSGLEDIDTNWPGEYTIYYEAYDEAGNYSEANRTVYVEEPWF